MEARNLVPRVISAPVDNVFKNITSEKVTHSVVSLFLVLYAGLAAPKLPNRIAVLFKESWFRFFILSLIAYMSTRDTSVAILATVAFVVTLNTLSKQEAKENFAADLGCMNYHHFKKLGGTYVKDIRFTGDNRLAADPTDSYDLIHKQKKLNGKRMILKSEPGVLDGYVSGCGGYAEINKFPYQKYRTKGLKCPGEGHAEYGEDGQAMQGVGRVEQSEADYCDNNKPEIENFSEKKNENLNEYKETTIEDFSSNSCGPSLDKGFYYDFDKIEEKDAQTCQGGKDWVKRGPLHKMPVSKDGVKYYATATDTDSNDPNPLKKSSREDCDSSEVSYEGQYWDPNETALLNVSFEESPPETFKTDTSEVSSEYAMSAN